MDMMTVAATSVILVSVQTFIGQAAADSTDQIAMVVSQGFVFATGGCGAGQDSNPMSAMANMGMELQQEVSGALGGIFEQVFSLVQTVLNFIPPLQGFLPDLAAPLDNMFSTMTSMAKPGMLGGGFVNIAAGFAMQCNEDPQNMDIRPGKPELADMFVAAWRGVSSAGPLGMLQNMGQNPMGALQGMAGGLGGGLGQGLVGGMQGVMGGAMESLTGSIGGMLNGSPLAGLLSCGGGGGGNPMWGDAEERLSPDSFIGSFLPL
jgi:hypothetical protein